MKIRELEEKRIKKYDSTNKTLEFEIAQMKKKLRLTNEKQNKFVEIKESEMDSSVTQIESLGNFFLIFKEWKDFEFQIPKNCKLYFIIHRSKNIFYMQKRKFISLSRKDQ